MPEIHGITKSIYAIVEPIDSHYEMTFSDRDGKLYLKHNKPRGTWGDVNDRLKPVFCNNKYVGYWLNCVYRSSGSQRPRHVFPKNITPVSLSISDILKRDRTLIGDPELKDILLAIVDD